MNARNMMYIKGPLYKDFVHLLKSKYFVGKQPEPAPEAADEKGRAASPIQRQRVPDRGRTSVHV